MKHLKLILLIVTVLNSNLYSQEIWNRGYEQAYEEILKLNFGKSDSILKSINVNNTATEAYISSSKYFINVMLNNYNNDDLKNDSISYYLGIVYSSEINSPWIEYFKVELLTMKSLINIRLDNKVAGAYSIYKATKITRSTLNEYPNFAPIKTLNGFQQCTFSQIPDSFKSLASFFGIEGDYDKGISEISESISNIKIDVIRNKSKFIHVFSQKEFGKQNDVRISNSIKNYNQYPVMIYYEGYLLYKDDKISEAKKLLLENESTWQGKMNYLNYFTGKMLAFSIDYSAEKYFILFLDQSKTDNFKQSSYRYLAYMELLKGNMTKYNEYVIKVKTNSYTSQSESDKSAYNAISLITQPTLIKTQLLFDGGNYSEAKKVILKHPKTSICHSENDFITYYYRLGSISMKLGDKKIAIDNFEYCTKFNFNNKFHYQANAYLHLGELYLSEGNKTKTKLNLEKCLDQKDFPYSYSIHGKAKKMLEGL